LSLLLAKKGISVQVVDAAEKLDAQPRATHYAPPAVHELIRAGVIDDVRAQGFIPRTVCWRKLDGTYLAGLDGSVLDRTPDRLTCLPLDKLGKILYDHLKGQLTSTIEWQHKVTSIGQDKDKAWVVVETPTGLKQLEADYIIGCDGANSQIRRSLFGDLTFPGKTWDEQIVATNVSPWNTKLLFEVVLLKHYYRPITTFQSTTTKMPISSSIQSIGIWHHG
jgi:2-polyprenyl-6-methoxyphenol hydroxylase-like FAD-dependent oxidoreductase